MTMHERIISEKLFTDICGGFLLHLGRLNYFLEPSCQKATALAAATFKESTPWDMGIRTV